METIQIQLIPSGSRTTNDNDPFQFAPHFHNWYSASKPQAWHPATDLIETDANFIVRMEIAGMNVADFDITLTGNILTIDGRRLESFPDCAFHQLEIPSGDFSSSVEIPAPIEKSAISAVYENGFLNVTLPKAKVKQIKVN